MPVAIAFSEYALVWIAVATLSHGVCRKLPPSASCGANAIACRNPSSLPHRVVSSSRTAAICSSSFASISRTSGGSGRRRATFCVMLTVRPKFVSTICPPCSWTARAAANAIDCGVSTPVINSFLPSSSMPRPSVSPRATGRPSVATAPREGNARSVAPRVRLGSRRSGQILRREP